MTRAARIVYTDGDLTLFCVRVPGGRRDDYFVYRADRRPSSLQ